MSIVTSLSTVFHYTIFPQNPREPLILDASCAPADISYPTDLNLLNQGRKQTEKIIDIL
jgi:hypothetical protein